jgi:hypothetical protein
MYTEKQIQLVMWMPKPTDSDEYCHLVLDTLRNLMDVCKENVVVEQETWSIAPLMNPTGMTRAYMYDATNLDRWQQDKKLMCNDCTNIDVGLSSVVYLLSHFTNAPCCINNLSALNNPRCSGANNFFNRLRFVILSAGYNPAEYITFYLLPFQR